MNIPFNKPYFSSNSLTLFSKALESKHYAGDGFFSRQSEKLLSELTKSVDHFLTPSCTHALELAILALGIGPGDEVILPSFTFTSCANAIVLSGATPVFVDVDQNTFCINLSAMESALTARTKAVLVVHYAGISPDMEKLAEMLEEKQIHIIEDNAHGLGAYFKDKPLGSIGTFATHSFHETKNIQCGEGGSIAINKIEFRDTVEIMREKGTNRKKFYQGSIQKYTWLDKGSSWIQSDLLSSLLLGQLQENSIIQKRRMAIWNNYFDELKFWGADQGVRLPFVPEYAKHTAHIFYLVFPSFDKRERFRKYLGDKGIYAPFHYQALHLSEGGQKFSRSVGDFSGTIQGSSQLLRLPIFYELTNTEQDYILETITKFKF